jgi:high affinity Mn2+ porin
MRVIRPLARRLALAALALLPALLAATPAHAQRGVAAPIYQSNIDSLIEGAEEWLARLEEQGWFLRGQMTNTFQAHGRFRSPYRGPNSLSPKADNTAMQTVDLVLGRRLWHNAEVVFVPSPTRGFGFSNNRGLGGLANTESFHGGTKNWDVNITRLFIRQTIDLSHDALGRDDDPMRFAGPLATERVTITAGKFSSWDFFDNNRYAHDGRTQFFNYALVGAGAFDIATDPAGYTHGVVLEWENGTWATRLGGFQVTRSQGSDYLDERVSRAWQGVLQIDRFWWDGNRPGALRLLLGASRTRAARYEDLTRALRAGADPERLRAPRTKAMLALNGEQELADGIGVFTRLAWNDARTPNWMFVEMDWSVSGGVSVNGLRWERPDDTWGLGFNIGGLSAAHRRFAEAGGIGFIIGDGRLRYRPERVVETYYDVQLADGLNAAANVQYIANPAFNADRGPALIFGARIRAAF